VKMRKAVFASTAWPAATTNNVSVWVERNAD
jgi:hypothetical protein